MCARGLTKEAEPRPSFRSLYSIFGAQVYSAVRVTRGRILLLLIINGRLDFRLMAAGFVAGWGGLHELCLVTRRMAQVPSTGINTRGSRCS